MHDRFPGCLPHIPDSDNTNSSDSFIHMNPLLFVFALFFCVVPLFYTFIFTQSRQERQSPRERIVRPDKEIVRHEKKSFVLTKESFVLVKKSFVLTKNRSFSAFGSYLFPNKKEQNSARNDSLRLGSARLKFYSVNCTTAVYFSAASSAR
jgi:hypothetical protein